MIATYSGSRSKKGETNIDVYMEDGTTWLNQANKYCNSSHSKSYSSVKLYLFSTSVEYVRNFSKRVRKKDLAVIIASQNLEGLNIEGIREYTKPLFQHSYSSVPVQRRKY